MEVEENEADLLRYRHWLLKIADRDYSEAPNGPNARAAVEAAAAELAEFEAEALRCEAPVDAAVGELELAGLDDVELRVVNDE